MNKFFIKKWSLFSLKILFIAMESSKEKLALTSDAQVTQPFSKPLDYTFMCLTAITGKINF